MKNIEQKQAVKPDAIEKEAVVEQFEGALSVKDWGPARFPILRRHLSNPNRFDAAVADVVAGVVAGLIRNAVLQDVKFALGRVVDEGWKQHVNEPFFYAGKWEGHPQDVQDLYHSIMILSLHDVISTSKKVDRSKASGPAVDAMRAYCQEVLPLAKAVAFLKDKVIKGRAPSTAPVKPENPNKVVKTCPVCFRAIAVQRDKMAHHGYQRPGWGSQTASCPGIRFKPLEVSSEGLEWLVSWVRESLKTARNAYAKRATLPEFLFVKRTYNGPMEKVCRGDALWQQAFDRHVAELRQEIGGLKRELPYLEKKLAEWAPEQS